MKTKIIIGIVVIVLVLAASKLFTTLPTQMTVEPVIQEQPASTEEVDVEKETPTEPLRNSTIETPTPATNSTATSITMLYKIRSTGRTWFAKWNNAVQRTLKSGQQDPFDAEFIARGNGTISLLGNGSALMAGNSPRMYVYDPTKKKKWGNVEVTVYSKRISEITQRSSQGIVIGARSEHQDATGKAPCLGKTYYARLLYDGRAVFQKEIVHEELYSNNMPSESNVMNWGTSDGSMPKNMWIGLKYIVRTNADKSVTLAMYIDLTDGKNGGTWKKVAEYTDEGSWPLPDTDLNVAHLCGYPANTILSSPATSIFIRNDVVSKVEYKNFSIREI